MESARGALLSRHGPEPFVKAERAQRSCDGAPRSPQRSIYVYVNVFSIAEISTTCELFKAYFFLMATWVEPGLHDEKDFNPDTTWRPRFEFMNAVETPDILDEKLQVVAWRRGPGGEPVVSWSCKCRGTFREQFELGAFPFDVQDLHVTITTPPGCSLFEDCFTGLQSKLRHEYTKLPEFEVQGPWLLPRQGLDLGIFPTMDIVFNARRRFSFHVWHVFIPVFLLTAMQFSVFAVDVAEVSDRLQVTLTLVLASVAYKYVVSEHLPNISYLTLCDAYVLASFVFTAAVVFENTLMGSYAQEDEQWARAHDDTWRRVFAAVFIFAHVIYIVVVLIVLRTVRGETTGSLVMSPIAQPGEE